MFPILLSIGPIKFSSFGVFLILGILAAIYLIWKLAKTYDIDEEKVFDLAILTFFGGVIGARLYFVGWNLDAFDPGKVILINKYPGLSLWGGILGGAIVLRFFVKRFKFNFWQVADFAAVGFLAGLILGNIGCFLGGCSYGTVSNLPIATSVIGVVGKRLPIAVIEGLMLLTFFPYLWKQALRFHFPGQILSLVLILIGSVKLITGIYRADIKQVEYFFPFILLVLGIALYYKKSKRHVLADLRFVSSIFTSGKTRDVMLGTLRKSCYNAKVNWKIRLDNLTAGFVSLPKILKRRFNVKSTPKNFR